jgi:ELWxxDGT repeat protein
VNEINPDISSAAPICGAVLGNEFICYREIKGVESLWKTDGTQEGTSKVKDVFVYRLDEKWMLNYKDIVYFASGDGLWRTDGTELGTTLIDGEPSLSGNPTDVSPQFTQAGDLFYFVADFYELWRSNGQEPGTTKLKKFDDGVQYLTAFKGTCILVRTTA